MRPRGDEGFTLVETMISIAVVSVVAAALTLFYVQSSAVAQVHSQTQAANQIASNAMEQLTLLSGDAVLSGRPACAVSSQWATPAPGTSTYLGTMKQASDSTLASLLCPTAPAALATLMSSSRLPLITTIPASAGSSAPKFTQYIYIGRCWQPRNTGACTAPASVPATWIPMYHAVIAITWSAARCPGGVCSYVTDTLVSQQVEEPTFSN